MKSFQEIFNEIIPPTEKFSLFGYYEIEGKCREIAENYAKDLLIDLRQRCYENSYIEEVYDSYEFQKQISESSILETEIILP